MLCVCKGVIIFYVSKSWEQLAATPSKRIEIRKKEKNNDRNLLYSFGVCIAAVANVAGIVFLLLQYICSEFYSIPFHANHIYTTIMTMV